eukprot:TRINITY_DN3072_c0_g3_i2.p1 TRINITY_DN3072_c0_g3~~TRINITY_DN3072_c0_g3_i2.p1  ORF type:complete len:717 (+),score=107.19 TRINITY_DN3072_c0_g3_i2:98-2248(+)
MPAPGLPAMEVQVAVSHLQLSLANLRRVMDHHTLSVDDCRELSRTAADLQALSTYSHSELQETPHVPQSPEPVFPSTPRGFLGEQREVTAGISGTLDVFDGAIAEGFVEVSTGIAPLHVDTLNSTDNVTAAASKGDDLMRHKQSLIDLFDVIDLDKSGVIETEELRCAMRAVDVHPASARRIVREADSNGDGLIERQEWMDTVESVIGGRSTETVASFLHSLVRHTDEMGSLKMQSEHETPIPFCMLSFRSWARVCWDFVMLLLLTYVATILPFKLVFIPESDDFADFEFAMDCFFGVDIILNFRTTYTDNEGVEVVDGNRCAMRYLTSWFVIDVLSALPFEHMTQSETSLQPLKVAKVSKLLRLLKVARIIKFRKFVQESEIGIQIEEFIILNHFQAISSMVKIAVQCIVLSHILACFLPVSGPGFLDNYSHNSNSVISQYVACLYWAMTTITTVGYGDITPGSDTERVFAMIAMIFGSGFYGYVIGNISVIIAHADLTRLAREERLGAVSAWLHTRKFPKSLRRRLWHYFKTFMSNIGAMDEHIILNDLSPDLRKVVADFLIHPHVRSNVVFQNLPSSALVHLVPVPRQITIENHEVIVCRGDMGTAMFIIIEGSALMHGRQILHQFSILHQEHASPESNETTSPQSQSKGKEEALHQGDSFGEEVLLGVRSHYDYTVTASSTAVLLMISIDEFLQAFKGMPEIISVMRTNFLD